jgi:CheY-like chemotaxis protein
MARVLIIDDDAPTRDVLRQLLNREGYEAVEACDGREGVQCSRQHPWT